MSFHHDRQQRRRRKIVPTVIILLLVLTFLGLVPGAMRIHASLWKAGDGWRHVLETVFSSAKHLRAENDRLHERIRFLEIQNSTLRQNNILIPVSDMLDPQVAHVVVQPHMVAHRQYIVDRGASDGIAVGDRAFAGDIAVGYVTKTTSKTAYILPLFASGNESYAVHGPTSTSFVLTGRGGGIYYLEVPRATDIVENDLFYWQDSRGIALVGYVSGVEVSDRDAVRRIHITMPVNPRTVQWVQIEVGSGEWEV